jgi:hypothetical protein
MPMTQPNRSPDQERPPGEVGYPLDETGTERERADSGDREGASSVERAEGGVEREQPPETGAGAGVESPPADADRAALLP